MAGHGNALSLISPGGLQLVKALTPVLASAASGEGGGGFLNNMTINTTPLLDFEQNIISVENAPVADLIDNIKVEPIVNVNQTSTQYLVDTLNRIAQDPLDVEAAKANFKARPPYSDPANHSQGVREQDRIQREALRKLHGSRVPSEGLEDDAKAIVKETARKPTDKFYVSREPHEFDYCMKPLKRENDMTTIEAVADAGDHIINVTVAPTLGLFIDAKEFRKTIELWRRLVNITHSRNAKKLTELMGTTRHDLLQSLIAEPTTKALLVAGCTGVPFLQPD